MFNQFQRAAGRLAAFCVGLVVATLTTATPAGADDFPVDVTIVTADTAGAGTDAVPISLTISYINTDGEENGYLLQIDEDTDPDTGLNRFEQGSTDVFRVELPTQVDHFTQIELTTNIANLDHVSQTFTMAPWTVASVTLTPVRNVRLPDGEIVAIQPTVFTIGARIDADIPTLYAYPDGHTVGEAGPAPDSDAEPVDQPELQPEPTTDSPGGAGPNKERCKALVQDHVAWDQNPRNTHWNDSNLDLLCSISATPEQIVACFQQQLVASNYDWRAALTTCQTTAASTSAGATSAPAAVRGQNASWIEFGDRQKNIAGYYVQTDAIHWEERDRNGVSTFAFDEEVRTPDVIKLIDRSRNIRIELNLAGGVVNLLDANGAPAGLLYYILEVR